MSSFRLVCLFLWGATLLAQAQGQSPVQIKKINYSLQNAPNYVISGGSNVGQGGVSSAQKWVVLEVEFETYADWINEATFDMYALVQNGNVQQNLQGTAIFQDIERGPSHRIAMFMSPETYKRYSGTATQQAIKDVAVKITIAGGLADLYSERVRRRNGERWWERLPPQPAILRTLKDTPWYPLSFGVYEQLKPGS